MGKLKPKPDEELNGKVLRLHGQHAWVDAGGVEYQCAVRGKFKQGKRKQRSPLAVGDEVALVPESDSEVNEATIIEIAERRTELYRAHPRFPRQRQVLAANIDLLVIVLGADRLEEQLITADRLLISARSQGLTPLIAVNKLDLRPVAEVQAAMAPYSHADVAVHYVSATRRELGDLAVVFSGRSAVFAGPSGVGKSSLMNALEPGLQLRVGEVDAEGEGRHTTTHASLVPMAGGMVIDTPGVRDFGFWNIELHEISLYYPDFEQLRSQCRFSTCTHRHEPHCAVKAAAGSGMLDNRRYQRYLVILREAWNQQEQLGH